MLSAVLFMAMSRACQFKEKKVATCICLCSILCCRDRSTVFHYSFDLQLFSFSDIGRKSLSFSFPYRST